MFHRDTAATHIPSNSLRSQTASRSQPIFPVQVTENNQSRSPKRPDFLVRRATLVLGGTMPGSCTMRTSFSSSAAIAPNRACRSSATAHDKRFFEGKKGVSTQKTAHHERFCPSTAPIPATKWLCFASKAISALSHAAASPENREMRNEPKDFNAAIQIELHPKNAKRTHQSPTYSNFPSYLHKHTRISASPTPPLACIIGER